MSQKLDLIQQKMALLQEAEIAVYSIETGLGHLAKNKPYAPKPYYSTGIERLLKIIICLHEFNNTGMFPKQQFFQKKFGHDLIKLLNEVVSRCYVYPYLDRDFAEDDYDFLVHDLLWAKIVSALNDFAKEDRYMFLNKVSRPGLGRDWPKGRWEEIERIALSDEVYFRLLSQDYPELCRRTNHMIQAHIERFTRALARLLVYGNLGDAAQNQYALLSQFLGFRDNELGKKSYEL
jgi:hypothetical protein